MNFPAGVSRMSDPGGAAAIARMVVELEVQLQQLADMQAQLEASTAQQQRQQSSTGVAAATPTRRSQQSSGGGSDSSALKPVWGLFNRTKSKKQQDLLAAADAAAAAGKGSKEQQQEQQAYLKMPGPVVVVFVAQNPEDLDPGLRDQLPVKLLLDLPASDAREDLLMGWLMEREAAVNVEDVEQLAR